MKKTILFLLTMSTLGFSQSLLALDTPNYSRADKRIQMTPYNAHDVVLIKAAVGRAVHIRLSDNEKVLDMASGNSEAWEFKDVVNNIYLKPRLDNANTNLVVTTDKRVYSFELKVVKAKQNPTYRLTFSYPDDIKAADLKRFRENYVNNAFKVAPVIANTNYTMMQGKNSDAIKPIAAFDDGTFTYVRFARGQDMPVIFKLADNGEEEIINSSVKGDYIVLHGIYKTMMIRGNSTVIGLYNEAFDGGALGTGTGTSSPDIQREVIK